MSSPNDNSMSAEDEQQVPAAMMRPDESGVADVPKMLARAVSEETAPTVPTKEASDHSSDHEDETNGTDKSESVAPVEVTVPDEEAPVEQTRLQEEISEMTTATITSTEKQDTISATDSAERLPTLDRTTSAESTRSSNSASTQKRRSATRATSGSSEFLARSRSKSYDSIDEDDDDVPPPPPPLEAGQNYTQPGAFRMSISETLDSEPLSSPPPLPPELVPAASMTFPTSSEEFVMLEASLVEDQGPPRSVDHDVERPMDPASPRPSMLVEAKPVKQGYNRKLVIGVVLLILLVAGVAAGVAVSLTSKNGDDSDRREGLTTSSLNETASSPPTPAPKDAATVYEEFQQRLPPYTIAALQNPASAQSQALEWLSAEENFTRYSDEQRMQRFALATLYLSTGGHQWTNKEGWLTNSSECKWYFHEDIVYSCVGKEFNGLGLIDNNLNGTLPMEIGLLTALDTLDISFNRNLRGSIPTTFGNLFALALISMSENELSSSIPKELTELGVLEYFDLEGNALTGTLHSEFAKITSLQDMYLSSNAFNGTLPPEFGDLKLLRTLWVRDNKLAGEVPVSYQGLPRLAHYDLSGNAFEGEPLTEAFLSSWSKLRLFDIGGNAFVGNMSSAIGVLDRLTYLDVYFNNFEGPIPTELGVLSSMQALFLEENLFTGTIPSELGQLSNVEVMHMYGNKLSGSVPTSLCQLIESKSLDLAVDCVLVQCDCGCNCDFTESKGDEDGGDGGDDGAL